MRDPTGEKQDQPFQLSFNASLQIDFHESRITSDGGLVLVRVRRKRQRLPSSLLIENGPGADRPVFAPTFPRRAVSDQG
jgi:hypothetical protein